MENKNEPERIKTPFLKKIKISIINIERYHIIAQEPIHRTIGYLLIIFLIFSCVTSIAVTKKAKMLLENVAEYVQDMPEFEINTDTFSIDSDEKIEVTNTDITSMKFVFDNTEDTETYTNDTQKFDGTQIIFTKNEMIVKFSDEQATELGYDILTSQIEDNVINNQTIIDFINNSSTYYIIFMYTAIFTFTLYFLTALIDVLFLSLLGFIVSRMVKLPLKFFAIFSMSASSMTLSFILNLIYLLAKIFTGFTMDKFQWMYTLVAYIYMISSILILRSNLIKTNNFRIEEHIKAKEKESTEEEAKDQT